jgi:HPt (histidine-containing phosphotransfer) domain-containing protein
MLARWLHLDDSPPADSSARQAPFEPTGDEKLVDFARIEEFVGSAEGVAEVLVEFRAAALADIAALKACLVDNDVGEACRLAHRIKGAARTIGAQRLAAAAEEVERAARLRDLPNARLGAECLLQDLKRLLAATGAIKESHVA